MSAELVSVAVEAPQHSGLVGALHYLSEQPLPPGTLLRVPLGKRELLGIVWHSDANAPQPAEGQPGPVLRRVGEVLAALPPMAPAWLALVDFAAGYYQRGVGELALSVLPPELRKLDAAGLAKRLARLIKKLDQPLVLSSAEPLRPVLGAEQLAALAAVEAGFLAAGQDPRPPPLLLHGITERALAAGRQALVLVPEINLTPQLEARFAERFPAHRMVALHSGLTPVQRLRSWLTAHLGRADIVLGTRMSVFAPLPRLGLIVVDEEHDPSYKQQEGARYSARDLAVYRAHLERVPVILGSATPSLETWQRALPGPQQRYRRLALDARAGGGALPRVRLFDMGVLPRTKGQSPVLAPMVIESLRQRLAAGEQSLVFLNRRGYAPVLHCADCGWKSGCPHCSAWRVFHKGERTLRCHHCGFTERVPRACPDCGNLDIAPLGRGTEKLEEQLAELLPGARIGRLDADTARGKGQLQARLAEVHAGEVDVLVGTQMVTKGHDFRRITLVVAVNPDSALFASDFRAPERLFALLMQAAGRAGRHAEASARSEMWVQTWHPQHPLYAALQKHDFGAFAQSQLAEREAAGLPPYSHLALLRAEARDPAVALAWLQAAAELASGLEAAEGVVIYPPVPPSVSKVAGIERLQMLVEAPARGQLQRLLAEWMPQLHGLRARHKGLARWAIDVDPLAI
jgi:primosomal protein N' (replication factor Y)